ncbi:MAG: response regulator transcription factor [Cryobacterium sp.]|nr:response regulator transcription factor [Cryobacterium sp.]MCO5294711.1 response regulator transcription factor [Homoserinimonas sp.]MCW5944246.1 response regulator transcription factor [Cryobacterium sp.]
MTRVLIVEDERSISEPLAYLLEREGYRTTVAEDGSSALSKFDSGEFDLVLLDIMLPGLSGTEVCRRIRARSTVPIIMLTARAAEVDIVVGLELGADDYVTKPYSSRELVARIRAVLRRREVPDSIADGLIEASGIVMDTDRHSVTVRGSELQLPLKEYQLLEVLMRNSGRVLTRGQLIDLVWGEDFFGDGKTLDVHVKRLRGRIEADPSKPEILVTVRGLGYRLED